ncbi:MAG: NAD(P)H-hydrate dehydratase [Candidatus Nealsonbacteria bacterium]|nr:NAD(P)H-hydrate dehydratase [Candidatus Nealsonbacteria bacterium]
MIEVSKDILKNIYKPRPEDSRKYDFGMLVVIGGSDFYSGSPALASMAAFRAGVDMVRILAPKRAADIIASFSPNLAAYPLEGKWLDKPDVATLISMTESAKIVARENAAVVIGGGLGRSKETQEAILEYLSHISVPVVVDTDAIYAIAQKPDVYKGKNFLFTPHGYEFFVLTGKEVIGKTDEERIKATQEEALRLGTTILLKGKIDIISDGKEVAVNKTGNPYMTVGGCGDTLAGIAGALMARGINPFLAGQAAAYINGKAGEIASESKKDGLMATDLIEAIPEVLH